MPRGRETDEQFEFALAELVGGIKREIVNFSAEIGVSANGVAARISAILSPARQGILSDVSPVQHETTGVRFTVEQVEMVNNAHRSKAPRQIEASRKDSPQGNYWSKMTPEQRSKEMKKRFKKWTPESKARWHNAVGKDHRSPKMKAKNSKPSSIQKIYQARSDARKKGLPLPPLPKEMKEQTVQ